MPFTPTPDQLLAASAALLVAVIAIGLLLVSCEPKTPGKPRDGARPNQGHR